MKLLLYHFIKICFN